MVVKYKTTSMKTVFKLFFFSTTLWFQATLQAQPNTLLKLPVPVTLTNFGMPILELSSIDGRVALMTGGATGVGINNFITAVYGQWLVSKHRFRVENNDLRLNFGHGGILLGYHTPVTHQVRLNGNLQIGWGRAKFKNIINRQVTFKDDNLLVINPALGVHMLLNAYMKFHLTGGYRWVRGNVLPVLGETMLDSWTLKCTIVFHWKDQ